MTKASLPFYRSVFFKTLMMTFAATIFAATSLGIANYRSARATAELEAREYVAALTPLIARQISGALRFSKAAPAEEALKALIAESEGEGHGAIALALLRKSADDRTCPFPGHSYPAATVIGIPSAVKRLRTAARIWTSATWRSKSRDINRWPSSFTQFIFVSTLLRR